MQSISFIQQPNLCYINNLYFSLYIFIKLSDLNINIQYFFISLYRRMFWRINKIFMFVILAFLKSFHKTALALSPRLRSKQIRLPQAFRDRERQRRIGHRHRAHGLFHQIEHSALIDPRLLIP